MSIHHSRRGENAAIPADIISGRAWIARSIRNSVFRNHCRTLGRTFRHASTVDEALRKACLRLIPIVAARSSLLHGRHSWEKDAVPVLVRMAAYESRWLRDPEAWLPRPDATPEEQWRDLAHHLFALWPMPGFFASAWRERGAVTCLARDWYCHLARGGSWRKAAGMPASFTHRALASAMQAPDHLGVFQALRWGQITAMGGTVELMDEVIHSPLAGDLEHEEIWSRLIQKAIADHRFVAREFGMIADVLLDLLRHHHVTRAKQLVRTPMAELRRHCLKRWRELLHFAEADGLRWKHADFRNADFRARLLHLANTTWDPMPGIGEFLISRRTRSEAPEHWTVRERCSQARIIAEGRTMHHCVGNYWRRCHSGAIAVFSLIRLEDDDDGATEHPQLTIEVNRTNNAVVQARGPWNRRPDDIQYQLLRSWAEKHQLRMAV